MLDGLWGNALNCLLAFVSFSFKIRRMESKSYVNYGVLIFCCIEFTVVAFNKITVVVLPFCFAGTYSLLSCRFFGYLLPQVFYASFQANISHLNFLVVF